MTCCCEEHDYYRLLKAPNPEHWDRWKQWIVLTPDDHGTLYTGSVYYDAPEDGGSRERLSVCRGCPEHSPFKPHRTV